MGTVRRYTGESILLHEARWEEDGGLGEGGTFARKPATEGGRRPCPLDEGSYGHRQQGKVPPLPNKLVYMWKKRRGGTPGIMRASASLR